ncbi:hypothetical protein K505DRAFT_67399 [Melanomma pulvis-pyrius CBS 109.77]|uniref:DUF7730 domain-containing protein n=1 Tax=Melanomma pulvis-pyrius CBS 109.77 TaxID=1314802 RepID=A0A6A6X4A5_9PLEO|nr:hypothetical protein K505DRAFT_67399 [Melanomma pulvis-pyrius CBS 109.77]
MTTNIYRNTKPRSYKRALGNVVRKSWNRVAYRPYKSVSTTLNRWIRPPSLPLVVFADGTPNFGPPLPLPAKRKRRLSITADGGPEVRTRVSTLVPNFMRKSRGQHTSPQSQCAFLKLPPEIRNQIYRLALGDQLLHIIPSLVPSSTLPPRFSWKPQPFRLRLDYAPCKYSQNPGAGGSVTPDPHSLCAIWINGEGELHSEAQNQDRSVFGARYRRWWIRRKGVLALVKTCRIIYSEAIPLLYSTNTFSFQSPKTFLQFPPTLLSTRILLLQNLHLHFTIKGNIFLHNSQLWYHRQQRVDEESWSRACVLLKTLHKLRNLTIELEDKRTGELAQAGMRLLEGLIGVEVEDGGRFDVLLNWEEHEWEREQRLTAGMTILRKGGLGKLGEIRRGLAAS